MIELRKADRDKTLGDVKCAKSANCGEAFSKLQKIFTLLGIGHWVKFILLVAGHWVRFSETCYIYNIIHLVTINHENQSDSLDALKKLMMAKGHLYITLPFNAISHLAMCELLRARKLNGNIIVNSFREPNHINFILSQNKGSLFNYIQFCIITHLNVKRQQCLHCS
jgi:hypothetical protein